DLVQLRGLYEIPALKAEAQARHVHLADLALFGRERRQFFERHLPGIAHVKIVDLERASIPLWVSLPRRLFEDDFIRPGDKGEEALAKGVVQALALRRTLLPFDQVHETVTHLRIRRLRAVLSYRILPQQ